MTRDIGQAVVRGVVLDVDDKWILGFNHYLGNCNPLEAELWAITDGILILLQKGFNRATIQSDSLEVVQLLAKKEEFDSEITILRRVRRILQFEGQWRLRFVPRERNIMADRLAKLGLS